MTARVAAVDSTPRLPPHHDESEQSVLGGLLIDNTALDRVEISEHDFYGDDHRRIWRAIVSLIDAGKPADVVTVAEALQASGDLERAGGLSYIAALAAQTPSAANIRSYAKAVRSRAVMRRLIEIGVRISDLGYAGGDAAKAVTEAQQAVMELDVTEASQESVSIRDALRAMVERVDAAFNGTYQPLKTGFADLDAAIVGLEPGDLIIVAGRPSMGKTALAMQIAEHVSETVPVQVFSLEMSASMLAMRMAAGAGKIDLLKLRTGSLAGDEWGNLTYAVGKLNNRSLYIDDRSSLTVAQIRARARQTKRKHGLGLVVIDYIGLIDAHGENRAVALASVSRSLKAMARELSVPVIVLSQLNRQVTGRTDKRPLLSDLRESGAIEQDADLILLLHRDDYYDPDSEYKGVAECIIGKQRNGPTGRIPLAFNAETARFGNYFGHYDPESRAAAKTQSKRGFL
jgi:replicative DNA helicase